MTIYEIGKMISSENKTKIIAHFWECECVDCPEGANATCVEELQELLGIGQANLSKHLSKMLKLGVLKYKQVDKRRYYSLSNKFKNDWKWLLDGIIELKEFSSYRCDHCIVSK